MHPPIHIFTYTHIHMHVCVLIMTGGCVRVYVRAHKHRRLYTTLRYIRYTHVHICVHTCICTHMHVFCVRVLL